MWIMPYTDFAGPQSWPVRLLINLLWESAMWTRAEHQVSLLMSFYDGFIDKFRKQNSVWLLCSSPYNWTQQMIFNFSQTLAEENYEEKDFFSHLYYLKYWNS